MRVSVTSLLKHDVQNAYRIRVSLDREEWSQLTCEYLLTDRLDYEYNDYAYLENILQEYRDAR